MGLYDDEKINLNCVWQIEHITDDNFGDNFYSYENNEEMLTPKMTTKAIKLRHFLTGRLFTLTQGMNKKNSYDTCLGREFRFSKTQNLNANLGPKGFKFTSADLNVAEDDSDYFEDDDPDAENISNNKRNHNLYFELVIVEEKYLRNKSLVYLKSKNSYMACSKIPHLERKNITGSWESEKSIKPLNNKDTDEKKKIIVFRGINDSKINKNILILNKVSKEVKTNLLFLRSMIPKFYKFIALLKETKWSKIKYHTYLEITELFKRIVEYLFGESKCINNNYWNITEQPNA